MNQRTTIFARIVAAGNGYIYLILKNYQCCLFSSTCLYSLLMDPLLFLKKGAKKFISPDGYPAPLKGDIMAIAGLTLTYLTEERQLICEYPEVICLALLHAKQSDEETHINLHEILCADSILDQKQCCIDVFLTLGSKANCVLQNNSYKLSSATQAQILSEILQSRFFADYGSPASSLNPFSENKQQTINETLKTPGVTSEAADNPQEEPILPFSLCNPLTTLAESAKSALPEKQEDDPCIPQGYIKLREYCTRYSISNGTIQNWISKGWISPIKDKLGHWWLNMNETPDQIRERNGAGDSRTKKKRNSIRKGSYSDIQRFIRENHWFSDAVRPYIRTYEEAKYYKDNCYREVDWCGNSALILDIDLEYYSIKHSATNRQLIISGHSPVVPNHEDQTFDLHHIGQKTESPLAIIPSRIHNSTEMYSTFHSGNTTNEGLHSTAFDLQRKKFWLVYVQQVDQYGGYDKIPFLHPKSPKD